MGKAAAINGLECSADAFVWAAEVLRTRFDEIAGLRRAVLASDDIEAVHEMRVATRRLRSALRDFAPLLRSRPLKTVRKDLKELADTLGVARDEDVALVALEKLQKKAPEPAVKTGIEKLIAERRKKRACAQRDLTAALAASALDDLQRRFHAAVEKAAQKKSKAQTVSFTDAGRAAVLNGLEEFCRLSESLYAPHRVKRLHRLRISAKRLRYAVELFTACRGEQLTPFAEEIAEMQSYLGEVHDADAWIESFSTRLLEDDQEISETNLWLLSRFVKLRTKNYRAALALWSKWQTERFPEKLREMILSAG